MKPLRTALVGISAIALSSPALAQDHSMHDMPGMEMPPPPKAKPAKARKPAAPPAPSPAPTPAPPPMPAEPDHGAMDHGAMDGMQMPEAAGAQSEDSATGTDQPAGSESPPPPPRDRYADRQFPPAEMARAHDAMMKDSGGQSFGAVILNIAEYQAHRGRDGYRWDGEAFYGGDINRLWIKSEGEGELRRGLDSGEVQVLYSRAVDPYFNLQAGVRQDIGPTPRRTYATIGFEGLAPGMFEVEGGLFLSNKGDLLGRLEGYYDQRITQRLILQPRVELNFAAQDIPENAIGSGLSNVELGARLRYEFTRQFAPYIGVSYYRKLGDTARFARIAGEDVHATSFVAGVRFWF
ncbi:MAG: hypothetical protein RL671_312 [Pseudomonadota bacterium]|jgi:copper resistance protein B